jgi:hypothetical protein
MIPMQSRHDPLEGTEIEVAAIKLVFKQDRMLPPEHEPLMVPSGESLDRPYPLVLIEQRMVVY